MRTVAIAVLAGASLLAGCNLAPQHIRPEGVVPEAFPQGGVYPTLGASGPDFTAVAWRDFFTDDRLRTVIETGLDGNRDLRVVSANVLAARARYGVQRADRLPSVGLTGSATFTDNPSQTGAAGGGDAELYAADLGFSAFELDFFGRVRNLNEAALQSYFASEAAQRSVRISLIAEIANAWLTLAADRDQLRLSREMMASFDETRRLTTERFRIGTTSDLEARQADAQYQGARADVAALEAQVARDRNALDLLVGAPVEDSLLPDGLADQGATLSRLPSNVSSEVLLRRPDVLQAEHLLQARSASIGAARAALFPSISLTGAGQSLSTDLSDLFSDGSYFYSLTPSVSVPIFDSGRRRSNVQAAEADQQAALATYEKAIQTAFREVADSLAVRGTIDEQVAGQTARAGSAAAAARMAEARYQAGVSSFLEALDARRTDYAAQQQLVSARLGRERNLIEVYRSLGGGLQ